MRSLISLVAIAALLFMSAARASEHPSQVSPQASPQQLSSLSEKIVSINLCLDGLLLALVARSRIDSVYYLSANPQFSPFAEQTKGLFLNRGLAEDIVPRNPDLILAGEFSSAELVTLLKQLKFRVEVLALPRSIADITAHIRYFGKLVGNASGAEVMAQSIEHQLLLLNAEQRKQARQINAFWYSSNGVVVGAETLENELMQHAGIHNLALDKNIIGFKQMDLEELILARPQVIIVESSDIEAFSLAREYIKHPALQKNNTRIIALPSSLSVCSAPVLADVIKELRTQVKEF
ncbi:MAG: ABC transporter substrate-binding protein [Pseudomonadota bacterium]